MLQTSLLAPYASQSVSVLDESDIAEVTQQRAPGPAGERVYVPREMGLIRIAVRRSHVGEWNAGAGGDGGTAKASDTRKELGRHAHAVDDQAFELPFAESNCVGYIAYGLAA